jgi:DNA-binding LacI/PurR family transcriptional regulator
LREAWSEMAGGQIHVLRHDSTAAHLCTLLDDCLRAPNPPTAFLVGGVPQVLTVMMHLMRRGRRIPKDAAVLSRDNDPILDAASPTVARYAIEPAQFASRIALAVRQLTETNTVPVRAMRLMPTFVPGESL